MNKLKNKLKIYIEKNLEEKEGLFSKLKCAFFIDKEMVEADDYSYNESDINLEDFLEKNEEKYNDFQTMLFKFIDEKDLKDSDVYNKVHIDRRLFSKIRSDKNYHPSKDTVILLAIALELSEKELDILLDSASYSLPKNNKYDLIIRFCFINKIFKITEINELLDEYKCKLFSY